MKKNELLKWVFANAFGLGFGFVLGLVALMVLQYGLTPAEGDVAVKISYGHSLEEIAQSNRHKVATTRNLLKRAFAKTGASRQAELSKIVWASAIPASLTGSHPDTSNP